MNSSASAYWHTVYKTARFGYSRGVSSQGGWFQWYLAINSRYGFTAVREMQYTSQHSCDKIMNGKMALYRECCFPNCSKSQWKKLLSQVLGGDLPNRPSWIRLSDIVHISTFISCSNFKLYSRKHWQSEVKLFLGKKRFCALMYRLWSV